MPLRIPPGRAGRTWLLDRLQIGRRGAELLDRKRQALLREQSRVRAQAAQALQAWQDAATQAATWGNRAAMLDGADRLELLTRHAHDHARLEVSESNLMGARIPAIEALAVPDPPPVSALGGSSAAVLAARSSCEAVRAAARHAVAQRAELELSAELRRTARRLRAVQERWIPQHEQALAVLELQLDESQREQAVTVRWLTNRTG